MCADVVNHTSRRSRIRTSSFRPIAKSNSVTPRSAATSSSGTIPTSRALMTNPAARNPTKGGRRTAIARPPRPNVMTR